MITPITVPSFTELPYKPSTARLKSEKRGLKRKLPSARTKDTNTSPNGRSSKQPLSNEFITASDDEGAHAVSRGQRQPARSKGSPGRSSLKAITKPRRESPKQGEGSAVHVGSLLNGTKERPSARDVEEPLQDGEDSQSESASVTDSSPDSSPEPTSPVRKPARQTDSGVRTITTTAPPPPPKTAIGPSTARPVPTSGEARIPATRPFVPPPGFKVAELQPNSFRLALSGAKQLWHITAPSTLPLDILTENVILNIQSPAPVVQYEGVEYAANYHTVPRASSVRLLLPTENGYKCSRQPIKAQLDLRRSLKLQQPTSLSSAKDVGSREQSGHESRIDKEPLEVPKDLKMRWLPSGCRPIARESKASLPDKTVDTPRRHSSKKRKRLSGLQAVA